MNDDDDTKVFEYRELLEARKKRITLPFWIAVSIIILLLLGVVALFGMGYQERKPVAMKMTHGMPSPLKSNHVIFRLGDEEIFRFIYEDSGDGRRYSFEIREGDS